MASPTPAALGKVELFSGLDESGLRILAEWLEREEVQPGWSMTHEGAAGYAFYVLESGTADVLIHGSVVRTLGPGDFFGEIAILGSGRQTATVTVTSPAIVWTMFGTRFRQLGLEHPQIAATIQQTATERLG